MADQSEQPSLRPSAEDLRRVHSREMRTGTELDRWQHMHASSGKIREEDLVSRIEEIQSILRRWGTEPAIPLSDAEKQKKIDAERGRLDAATSRELVYRFEMLERERLRSAIQAAPAQKDGTIEIPLSNNRKVRIDRKQALEKVEDLDWRVRWELYQEFWIDLLFQEVQEYEEYRAKFPSLRAVPRDTALEAEVKKQLEELKHWSQQALILAQVSHMQALEHVPKEQMEKLLLQLPENARNNLGSYNAEVTTAIQTVLARTVGFTMKKKGILGPIGSTHSVEVPLVFKLRANLETAHLDAVVQREHEISGDLSKDALRQQDALKNERGEMLSSYFAYHSLHLFKHRQLLGLFIEPGDIYDHEPMKGKPDLDYGSAEKTKNYMLTQRYRELKALDAYLDHIENGVLREGTILDVDRLVDSVLMSTGNVELAAYLSSVENEVTDIWKLHDEKWFSILGFKIPTPGWAALSGYLVAMRPRRVKRVMAEIYRKLHLPPTTNWDPPSNEEPRYYHELSTDEKKKWLHNNPEADETVKSVRATVREFRAKLKPDLESMRISNQHLQQLLTSGSVQAEGKSRPMHEILRERGRMPEQVFITGENAFEIPSEDWPGNRSSGQVFQDILAASNEHARGMYLRLEDRSTNMGGSYVAGYEKYVSEILKNLNFHIDRENIENYLAGRIAYERTVFVIHTGGQILVEALIAWHLAKKAVKGVISLGGRAITLPLRGAWYVAKEGVRAAKAGADALGEQSGGIGSRIKPPPKPPAPPEPTPPPRLPSDPARFEEDLAEAVRQVEGEAGAAGRALSRAERALIESAEAQKIFARARAIPEIVGELTEVQKLAILRAHAVPPSILPGQQPGLWSSLYSVEDLAKKAEILSEHFTPQQWKILMREGVCGEEIATMVKGVPRMLEDAQALLRTGTRVAGALGRPIGGIGNVPGRTAHPLVSPQAAERFVAEYGDVGKAIEEAAARGGRLGELMKDFANARRVLAQVPLESKLAQLLDESPALAKLFFQRLNDSKQAVTVVRELNSAVKASEDMSFIGKVLGTKSGLTKVVDGIEAGKPAASALIQASKVSRTMQALKFTGKAIPVVLDAFVCYTTVLEWQETTRQLEQLRSDPDPNMKLIRLKEQEYFFHGAQLGVSGTGAVAGGCLLFGVGGTLAAPVVIITLPISVALGVSYAAHQVSEEEALTVEDWRNVPLTQRLTALKSYTLTQRTGHSGREFLAGTAALDLGPVYGPKHIMGAIEGDIQKKQKTDRTNIRSFVMDTTTVGIPSLVMDSDGKTRKPNEDEIKAYQAEINDYVEARVQYFLSRRPDQTHALPDSDLAKIIEDSEYAGQLAKDRPRLKEELRQLSGQSDAPSQEWAQEIRAILEEKDIAKQAELYKTFARNEQAYGLFVGLTLRAVALSAKQRKELLPAAETEIATMLHERTQPALINFSMLCSEANFGWGPDGYASGITRMYAEEKIGNMIQQRAAIIAEKVVASAEHFSPKDAETFRKGLDVLQSRMKEFLGDPADPVKVMNAMPEYLREYKFLPKSGSIPPEYRERVRRGEALMHNINANHNGDYYTKSFGIPSRRNYLYMTFDSENGKWLAVHSKSPDFSYQDPSSFSMSEWGMRGAGGEEKYNKLLKDLDAINKGKDPLQ